jgi:hypothetical protein
MTVVVLTVVFTVAFLVVGALVVWVSHRTLMAGGGSGGGFSDALGNFIDVFDPGKSRVDDDLKSQKHQGPMLPSPDEDDRPVRIVAGPDGRPAAVRIRVPRQPPG